MKVPDDNQDENRNNDQAPNFISGERLCYHPFIGVSGRESAVSATNSRTIVKNSDMVNLL